MNVLYATNKLYALNAWILWCVKYVLIKVIFFKKTMKGLKFHFYLQDYKLVWHSFTDIGKTYETPTTGKIDFITPSTGSSIGIFGANLWALLPTERCDENQLNSGRLYYLQMRYPEYKEPKSLTLDSKHACPLPWRETPCISLKALSKRILGSTGRHYLHFPRLFIL